eukprot:jgi/Chrzof1/6303/Cz18g01010.t1
MQELVLGVLEHGSVQHQSFTVQLEHDALHRHSFRLQLELSWPAASKVSPCIRSADGFKHIEFNHCNERWQLLSGMGLQLGAGDFTKIRSLCWVYWSMVACSIRASPFNWSMMPCIVLSFRLQLELSWPAASKELVLGVLEHGGVQHQSFTVQLEHDALHRLSFSLQLELSWPAASKVSPCIRSADGLKH